MKQDSRERSGDDRFRTTTAVFPLRRKVIKMLGGVALAGTQYGNALRALAQSAVVASPSLTEGPYFVDEDMDRADIRMDPSDGSVQAGYPLSLAINVSQLKSGAAVPLVGSIVDIWHCNALGLYSDIAAEATTAKKYLRGYQPTNREGNAYFLTVYPGWYMGRSVHVHVKVRIFDGASLSYEFTTQFFFDDSFTNDVYKLSPYNTRGARDTLNSSDSIYQGASYTGTITGDSGSYLMLTLAKQASWVTAQANLVCDLSLGSTPDQDPGSGGTMGLGGGPMPPPNGGPPGSTPSVKTKTGAL